MGCGMRFVGHFPKRHSSRSVWNWILVKSTSTLNMAASPCQNLIFLIWHSFQIHMVFLVWMRTLSLHKNGKKIGRRISHSIMVFTQEIHLSWVLLWQFSLGWMYYCWALLGEDSHFFWNTQKCLLLNYATCNIFMGGKRMSVNCKEVRRGLILWGYASMTWDGIHRISTKFGELMHRRCGMLSIELVVHPPTHPNRQSHGSPMSTLVVPNNEHNVHLQPIMKLPLDRYLSTGD